MKDVILLLFPGKRSDSSALVVSSRERSKMTDNSKQLEGIGEYRSCFYSETGRGIGSEHRKSTEKFGRQVTYLVSEIEIWMPCFCGRFFCDPPSCLPSSLPQTKNVLVWTLKTSQRRNIFHLCYLNYHQKGL